MMTGRAFSAKEDLPVIILFLVLFSGVCSKTELFFANSSTKSKY